MTTHSQLRAIHALRRRLDLHEEDYRALLVRIGGAASAKNLSTDAANRVVVELKRLAGQHPGALPADRGGRRPSQTASGRFAPVLQALWISAWNLGLVRSRDDGALLAFVARQTGAAHTRFLTDPREAVRAIEALKSWIAREAELEWPQHGDALSRKIVVAWAIARRLHRLGDEVAIVPFGVEHGLPMMCDAWSESHWDRVAELLGKRLRALLKRKPTARSKAA
jgi:hypothetical protein